MAETIHASDNPGEPILYPEHIRAILANRPAPPALRGLIEVERRLAELAEGLPLTSALHPGRVSESIALLHDALDELRQVVATIAGSMGLL